MEGRHATADGDEVLRGKGEGKRVVWENGKGGHVVWETMVTRFQVRQPTRGACCAEDTGGEGLGKRGAATATASS